MAMQMARSAFERNMKYFAVIGIGAVSLWSICFLRTGWKLLKTKVLASRMQVGVDLKKCGDWAIVTGPTRGIGKEYAFQLAEMGLNVVLIGRDMKRLDYLAEEIREKHSAKVICIDVDFARDPKIWCEVIREVIDRLDIGVLVNNVGMALPYPEFYHNIDIQMVRDMMTVNMASVAEMTALVLPRMVERHRGAIINLSSLGADYGYPMMMLYSATKAFIHTFSLGIEAENRSNGIAVQCFMPSLIDTEMGNTIDDPQQRKWKYTEVSTSVRLSLNTVGVPGQICQRGEVRHLLYGMLLCILPTDVMIKSMINNMSEIRHHKLGSLGISQKREAPSRSILV